MRPRRQSPGSSADVRGHPELRFERELAAVSGKSIVCKSSAHTRFGN
jgi:hypothetical protein